jgi:predicted protein tyrosine phosphatase
MPYDENSMIHVCSLARLHSTVKKTGARHVVTLLTANDEIERPAGVPSCNHLFLRMHDINEPLDGHVAPDADHVADLLDFVRGWDQAAPLVVHCWAGISRSTAAAFVSVCALKPQRDEREIAWAIRRASPTATPNMRIVAFADNMLARKGRMVAAIDEIGRGETAAEGVPFRLDLA